MDYVYKYVKNEKPEYIGITNNLVRRHSQHMAEWKDGRDLELYYFLANNCQDAAIWETVLINKYIPPRNIAKKVTDTSISRDSLPEPETWYRYKETKSASLKRKRKEKDSNIYLSIGLLFIATGVNELPVDFDVINYKYKMPDEYDSVTLVNQTPEDRERLFIQLQNYYFDYCKQYVGFIDNFCDFSEELEEAILGGNVSICGSIHSVTSYDHTFSHVVFNHLKYCYDFTEKHSNIGAWYENQSTSRVDPEEIRRYDEMIKKLKEERVSYEESGDHTIIMVKPGEIKF